MNRPRHSQPIATRTAVLAACLVCLMSTVATAPARAVCQFEWIWEYYSDNGYSLDDPNEYSQMNVTRPYWIAWGAIAADSTADYDVAVYQKMSVWSPCAEPECFCTRYANSVNASGRTDFVIGDFNHNPLSHYWVWTHCYNGSCVFAPAGVITWRSGDLVSVNAGPRTIELATGSGDGSQVLSTFDVYLHSGTTYYFNFHATGDRQTKILLFGNLAGGTYWAGRNAALFETSQCMTSYTASVSGYYGIVIVNDRLTNNPASASFGVTTTVSCNCPDVLVSGVPQSLPANPGDARDIVIQEFPYWTAVGVRSAADWDLTVGNTPSAPPQLGCPTDVLTWSNLLAPQVDVLAGDYNWSNLSSPEDTVSVRVSRFSGFAPAAVEMDGSSSPADIVMENGAKQTGTLYSDQVVRSFDVLLEKDTTYTFSLQTCCASQKLLLFGNSTQGVLWQGRASALLETSGTATFTPTFSGYYGAVVVKEDANVGGFSLGFGRCVSPTALAARTPLGQNRMAYCTFDQPANHWAAVGVYGLSTDWDIHQYDQATGSAWPDCFGNPGALSAGASSTDFIVGDFHYNSPGTQYARAYQYTGGASAWALTEWDPGSGELEVNGAPLTVTLDEYNDHHLWSYQVYLVSGLPYTFEFHRVGAADTHLLAFMNPTNGVYWAPRSAALFTTTVDRPYIAQQTGWYAVVVVLDNADTGRFTLRVSSPVVAVEGASRPARDALTSLTPNPARGPVNVGFALARDAEPAFELLDAQGRLLNRWSRGTFASGHWEVRLLAGDDQGRALAPGLYFVRMRLGSRTVATRKLAVAP